MSQDAEKELEMSQNAEEENQDKSHEEEAEKKQSPSPVILHIDVDAFECQVHQRLRPDLKGRPVIVANSRGRITSVNYEAKKYGISRDLRVMEARRKCPDLELIEIPDHPVWGKPDSMMARYSSWQILDDGVLPYRESQKHPIVINFASTDEFFFDVTELVTARMAENPLPRLSQLGLKTVLEEKRQITNWSMKKRIEDIYPEDLAQNSFEIYKDEARLMHGAIISHEIAQSIFEGAKFKVSCGVGHNMLLAKLATALNKPNGITILPIVGLDRVAEQIKIESIPGLGGKYGKLLKETLDIKTMTDLQKQTLENIELALGCEKTEFAKLVKDWSFGIDLEQVQERLAKDTISCGKTFYSKFKYYGDFYNQVGFLLQEIMERIQEEKYRSGRLPVSLRVEVSLVENKELSTCGCSFDWEDISFKELLRRAIDGLFCLDFSPKTNKYTRAATMKVIVTKLKVPEESDDEKLK